MVNTVILYRTVVYRIVFFTTQLGRFYGSRFFSVLFFTPSTVCKILESNSVRFESRQKIAESEECLFPSLTRFIFFTTLYKVSSTKSPYRVRTEVHIPAGSVQILSEGLLPPPGRKQSWDLPAGRHHDRFLKPATIAHLGFESFMGLNYS